MSIYRIILADDHLLFRQGVKRILEEQDGIMVVGEAGDGIALLKLLNKETADMVILDISMPGMRGIEVAGEIKSIHPRVRVLILTMHRDMEYLQHAISAGVSGFLLKEDADVALLSAIQEIQRGNVYVSPLLRDEMTEYVFRAPLGGKKKSLGGEGLTTREKEVLKLIAEGKTSKEIAALFSISIRTVQHHRANLMQKLNMRKTADLVKYAIRRGYTET